MRLSSHVAHGSRGWCHHVGRRRQSVLMRRRCAATSSWLRSRRLWSHSSRSCTRSWSKSWQTRTRVTCTFQARCSDCLAANVVVTSLWTCAFTARCSDSPAACIVRMTLQTCASISRCSGCLAANAVLMCSMQNCAILCSAWTWTLLHEAMQLHPKGGLHWHPQQAQMMPYALCADSAAPCCCHAVHAVQSCASLPAGCGILTDPL